LIEHEAGVAGLVLRPLSALNMPVTIPEERGLIDRSKLFGMSGRSRRPQMALARELGLTEYPSPAGGCLLTEELYSRRLRRLLESRADVDFNDLELLRSGRQCWTETGAWIVIGRDEADNARIETLRREGDKTVLIHGVGSPVAIVRHSGSDEDVRLAASICARYTKLRGEASVEARTTEGVSFMVAPMTAGEAEKRLI
ncbi:MAG: tRNA 4-thiouridine(8) synthase ThiI, partial [Nitrospirae bacterium]|nr:tRNA 4-thiouridine(8) synthase ThiI [Nitrospirota bacterium]